MCSMKGSASVPSSATMKGTRCDMRPATNATSRDSRSNLATTTEHFCLRASANAAARLGRKLRASAPLPTFDLDELLHDRQTFYLCKALDCRSLRVEPQAGFALALRRHTVVGENVGHNVLLLPYVAMSFGSWQLIVNS